jgi:uncharacterized membrane protein YesL
MLCTNDTFLSWSFLIDAITTTATLMTVTTTVTVAAVTISTTAVIFLLIASSVSYHIMNVMRVREL